MTKIPNYIKQRMNIVADHTHNAINTMKEIEEWLIKNEIDPMDVRTDDGRGLQELECANHSAIPYICENILEKMEENKK